MNITFTDVWLQHYADHLCPKIFNAPYDGPIYWSKRMRKNGGYFESRHYYDNYLRPRRDFHHYRIVINEHLIQRHPDIIRGVVGHELCHYYDFISNRPFSDGDASFQQDLKARRLPIQLTIIDNPKAYLYACPHCGRITVQGGKSRLQSSCAVCDPHHFDKRYLIRYLGTAQLHGTYNNQTSYQAFVRIGKGRLAKLIHPKQLSLFADV